MHLEQINQHVQAERLLRRLENTVVELLRNGDDELADRAIANYRTFRDEKRRSEAAPANVSSVTPIVRVGTI